MHSQILCGKQMVACEQGRGFWLCKWPRLAQNSMLYASWLYWSIVFQLWFECCKYRHQLSAMKKIKTSVSAQKSLIDRALPEIQSNLISRTSSLVQPTIFCRMDSGIDLIVKFQNCHCFWSQCIYYITIDACSDEHCAEKILSLSNIQQMSAIQQWELFIHMYMWRFRCQPLPALISPLIDYVPCWIALLCLVVCITRRCQIVSSFVPGGCCVALQMLMRAGVLSWIKPSVRFCSSLGSVMTIYSTKKEMDKQLLRPRELCVELGAPDAGCIFAFWLRAVEDFIDSLRELRRDGDPEVNRKHIIINCL